MVLPSYDTKTKSTIQRTSLPSTKGVTLRNDRRARLELCEGQGGRPGLPVPNKPYGFCGRKATLNFDTVSWFGLAVRH